ncbi:glycine betaine ABC transporter substrate-binding protein [Rhizobium etli]|uniref:Glycine betaine/proline transport system substrate-binding protein n=1 Tax=Rhizobium etli TaxID=29449 RepID=A0A7W7ECJ8_RHIET|nr:glycine betaine ABC transporter substrate-binding protein [Rhizobium etli]MBB4477959.1 glycine betaine/proline transport system substrate-binding protein [Rhizobium etli]MBB4533791.1 glycine betaine/proline transport system substrate-binding protein [Rhizobium etli]
MTMKTLLISAVFAAAFSIAAPAAAGDCGQVSIAEMKWASAGIAANFDKIILEMGYGCSVTIVAGDTLPTFASMNEKGTPDIASEYWINSVRALLDQAVKTGRLVQGAEILADGAVEGWFIPKFIADANPDIRSVEDALRHPELFPAEDDTSKGAIYNCPPDWSCHISTTNLFRALAADKKGFELVETGSPERLDASIARAFENKVGWLGYYWAPTAILGKYDMTRLSFGVGHNKTEWDGCTAVAGCTRPQLNSYPVSRAFTLMTRSFATRAGPVTAYLKTRKWDNATINQVLAWQDENRESNENAAIHFLRNYVNLWTKWVPADIAEKVKASL